MTLGHEQAYFFEQIIQLVAGIVLARVGGIWSHEGGFGHGEVLRTQSDILYIWDHLDRE